MKRRLNCLRNGIVLGLVLGGACLGLKAAAPKGVPAGETLADHRLGELKDLNGYFPFSVPATVSAWETRANLVRERILVSQGLWPLPEKTPLNPVIHGKMSFGDYSVEKVYFESFPGFYVTGNLYRPIGRSGRLPGILCPHGHWADGRFVDNKRIREEIVAGAERFENGGRSVLQSRCVQLARMGCVVFHYDMVGYADSVQISYELAHRFAKQRPEMNRSSGWGLFSPQAESHLQSVMGLQTWNSIRSLDFLETLPEVDPSRLAVTGASGGGTQTFILGAIDPRPAVAFPAVMVCTAMQGGCTCENSTLLRVGVGNVEIAGLFAPKPMGLSGANDWTVEMTSKGFPELQSLYGMMQKKENVMLKALNHFGHNYNYVSRSAMYHWFNKHLYLGVAEPIIEEDYSRLSREDLTVWGEGHPVPKSGDGFERHLLEYWHEDSQDQIMKAAESSETFAAVAGPAVRAVVGRTFDDAGTVEWVNNNKVDRGDYLEMSGLLKNQTYQESVPVVFLYPKEWNGTSVLWLDPEGKDALYGDDGQPVAEVKRMLSSGVTVVGVDLLFQGESSSSGEILESTRRVANPREAAPFTFGYNSSVFAKRVHDVLTTVKFMKTHDEQSKVIGVVALAGAGHWATTARSVLGDTVDRYAIDTEGFRFGEVDRLHDVNFLPGGAKYLDIPGLLLLGDMKSLWLAGEPTSSQQRLRKAYSASEVKGALMIVASSGSKSNVSSALDWILK
jgi:hypothetical protein